MSSDASESSPDVHLQDTPSAAVPACGAGPRPRRPRGRPLSFDRDAALEKAMHVFWERGYESASIAELTAAMGITPPSLYAAFGDKEGLFLEAIERYALGPGGIGTRAMAAEPTARGAIERLLLDAAEELTRPCHPKGCLMVTSAVTSSLASERVHQALERRRQLALCGIRDRIARGVADGELPADTDVDALTDFYATIYRGMSLRARDGATREGLEATARMAMRSWPAATDAA